MTSSRRGICPVCDREYDVTTIGRIRSHSRRRGPDSWGRVPECDGAGQPPKPGTEVANDTALARIAEAEDRGRRWAIEALRDETFAAELGDNAEAHLHRLYDFADGPRAQQHLWICGPTDHLAPDYVTARSEVRAHCGAELQALVIRHLEVAARNEGAQT